MRKQSILAVLAAVVLAAPLFAQDGYQYPSKVAIAWNQLNNYDRVVEICNELVAAYPDLLKIESTGKSVEGRDMWALTLNVETTGPHSSKPGIYIDGNIHGNEVQGTEVVLYTIWYLTKSYGKVQKLTELMDRCSFYFVPMINPDGRAHWFDAPNTMHSSRGGKKPVDNDGDGLFDEDPPNDIDGDGQLLRMRRKDPNGRWRDSPSDPRIMVRVKPDDKGDFQRYEQLGGEGIDDDGDGRINEDGPGGYDTNRNWPADWQPNYIQYGSGDFPLSLPESKAVADFVLARPNIAAAQSYHNSGGMILRGPGAKYVDYPKSDIAVYDRIGKLGETILPFYRYMIIWKDLYGVHGGFVNWVAEDLGIISFTNELWSGRQMRSDQPNDSGSDGRMAFNDNLLFGQAFVDWKPFDHPTYGPIELGGWVKMTGRVPPAFHLEELCHRNFAFTMYHADQMPLIELQNLEAKSIGNDLWRVTVDVFNKRLIPTTTAQAAKRRIGPRDCIEIRGEGIRVVAGGTVADRFTAPLAFVEHNPHKLWIDNGIRGERKYTYQWIVAGQGRVKIDFSSARAQDVTAETDLK